MNPKLADRLTRLEQAQQAAAPVRFTPEERGEVVRRYEATLDEPGEPDPRAAAYWATATVHQLAADYDAMLKGAPAPWV